MLHLIPIDDDLETLMENRWISATERNDGLVIMEGGEGYVILPRGDHVALDKCPCCDNPFRTIRAAQLIADEVFPDAKAS